MSPFKPTREDATSVRQPEQMNEEALSPERGMETRQALGEGRQSRGDAAGNQRHPPHVTENFEDAPIQDERPGGIEPLPANASGTQEIDLEADPQEIDPESMYDRRPGEDKDAPPSSRVD